jgi:hypothetical protein
MACQFGHSCFWHRSRLNYYAALFDCEESAAPRGSVERVRRALAPRGGGEEHRGLRRRGPAGAARAPGPLGDADGGLQLNRDENRETN